MPLFAELDDPLGLGEVHPGLAQLAVDRGQSDVAAAHLAPALAAFLRAHNRVGQARARNLRGDLARFAGDADAAADDYRAAAALLEGVQSWMAAIPHVNLGLLMLELGQAGAARAQLEAALPEVQRHHAIQVELCARAALVAATLESDDRRSAEVHRNFLLHALESGGARSAELSGLLARADAAAEARGLAGVFGVHKGPASP